MYRLMEQKVICTVLVNVHTYQPWTRRFALWEQSKLHHGIVKWVDLMDDWQSSQNSIYTHWERWLPLYNKREKNSRECGERPCETIKVFMKTTGNVINQPGFDEKCLQFCHAKCQRSYETWTKYNYDVIIIWWRRWSPWPGDGGRWRGKCGEGRVGYKMGYLGPYQFLAVMMRQSIPDDCKDALTFMACKLKYRISSNTAWSRIKPGLKLSPVQLTHPHWKF